uniref:NADH-ubiquinone oxidoreductase chain 6 n=1 Tax=Ramulus hainanense TaxID=556494 RepID=C7SDQ0_9NEOP|nr:NADH dehydrogenase subunit 6 [Ramulus hainanense]ACH78291.1 NADH dehydrogenase subunit 6 [Ramulus hainanense]
MKIMLIINTMMNITFIMMKHPLSMGVIIIMQTIIIALTTGMMFKTFWFSYILFLMYVGGMMVLFIYMTSLMPNMMFNFKKTSLMMIIFIMMMAMFTKYEQNMMNNDMTMYFNNNNMLTKMYSTPANMSTIMLVSYLFFTMITIYKITDSNKGPLRKMN